MKNVVVVGSQWGDEGKGKIVDWISSKADMVVRFQGGNNAGHTIKINDKILPHLSEIELLKKFPHIIVDMGAIKFVCKGANIMRPGITKLTDFNDGAIICVVEESNNKFLSVGIAKMSSDKANSTKTGIVVENLHYISDKFWETKKEIKD